MFGNINFDAGRVQGPLLMAMGMVLMWYEAVTGILLPHVTLPGGSEAITAGDAVFTLGMGMLGVGSVGAKYRRDKGLKTTPSS